MAIKNIIFDLGGVILNIDFTITQNAFKQLGMQNVEKTFGQHLQIGFFDKYDRGEISADSFINHILELLPENTNSKSVVDAWNAMLFDLPLARFELLKQLKNNYRTFLMSNTNTIHYEAYTGIVKEQFGIPGLDSLFEKAYYSFIVNMRKPEVRFFETIIKENKLNPDETLFIDDTPSNLPPAESLGIHTLFLKPGLELIDFFNNGKLKMRI